MCNIIAFPPQQGYANAAHCYGIRASPFLFRILLDFNPVFCIATRAARNLDAYLSTSVAVLVASPYSRRALKELHYVRPHVSTRLPQDINP